MSEKGLDIDAYAYLRLPDPEQFGAMAHVVDEKRTYEYGARTPYGVYDYYLDEQEAVWSGHTQHIEALHRELDPSTLEQPPKIVVAIPVAGHQEAAFVKHTLSQYSKQLLSKSLWEVVLFVNAPSIDHDGEPTSMQETLDQIEAAKQEYDLPNLRLMRHIYDEPQPMGKIRKDLWDTIVYDAHSRRPEARTLVVNNDSDTVHLRNDYLTEIAWPHIVGGFKQVRAPLRFANVAEAPIASKLIRYYWHMYTAYMHKHGLKPAVEGNSAFDLATYCAVGGFDPTKITNEYNDLRNRTEDLNSSRLTRLLDGDEAWAARAPLKTSSRRQLATVALGHSLNHTWNTDNIPFTAYDNLRVMPPAEAAETVARARLEDFIIADAGHFGAFENTKGSREFNEAIRQFSIKALHMVGLLDEFCDRTKEEELAA